MSSDGFEDTRESWVATFFAMHLLGQLLCLASNGTIVVVILRTRHLRTVSSTLVLALTFSDLLLSVLWNVVGLGTDLNTARNFTDPARKTREAGTVTGAEADETISEPAGPFSPGLCSLLGFLWQSVLATSTLYQALVACDRYLFIVHPLRYEAFVTRKKALVVLVLLALLALVLPTAALLSGGSYTYLPAAGTCVSHITWYVLFILLVYLPSLAMTLASNLGIWSLCVRQLNTPGRARLVREVAPHTDAFNLLEENGRVAVRRDIVDDFNCCIPIMCRNTPAGERDSTTCLDHLVQNSSLLFVEGFIAAVPVTAASNDLSSPGCCQNAAGPNLIRLAPPTVCPPSPSPSELAGEEQGRNNAERLEKTERNQRKTNGEPPGEVAKAGESQIKHGAGPAKQTGDDLPKHAGDLAENASSKPEHGDEPQTENEQSSDNNLKVTPNRYGSRSSSDLQSEKKPLTPRLAHKPMSSPSALSSRSGHGHRFRKTPSSFLLSHDLTDSLAKSDGGGESQQEDGSRLMSHGVCSILKTSPALSLEALEKLELSMQRFGTRNLRVTGLSTSSYPSTTSLRSVISDSPGFFRCASAVSANADSGGGASSRTTDKAHILSAIDNPIIHWMVPNLRLGLQRSVTESERKREDGEEGAENECDVIAERRAPLRRRAKTAVLVALPVVSLFLTMLPLVGVQTLWTAGVPVSDGVAAWVCHVMYVVIPSLNPFLIGLTNRHLRHAMTHMFSCRQN